MNINEECRHSKKLRGKNQVLTCGTTKNRSSRPNIFARRGKSTDINIPNQPPLLISDDIDKIITQSHNDMTNINILSMNLSPNSNRASFSLSPSRTDKIEKLLPDKSPEYANKKTLLIDLDETLVHSGFTQYNPNIPSDIILNVVLENKPRDIHVLVRPGVEEFLYRMSRRFEIIIFTASLSKYANPLIDILDKRKVCKYRLFREHCTFINGAFVKDLKKMNRDLKDLILLDNSPIAYAFHPNNGVPIKNWYDDKADRELYNLAPIIEFLSYVDDVRTYIPLLVINHEVSLGKAMTIISEYNENLKKEQMKVKKSTEKSINIKIVNTNITNYIIGGNNNDTGNGVTTTSNNSNEINTTNSEKRNRSRANSINSNKSLNNSFRNSNIHTSKNTSRNSSKNKQYAIKNQIDIKKKKNLIPKPNNYKPQMNQITHQRTERRNSKPKINLNKTASSYRESNPKIKQIKSINIIARKKSESNIQRRPASAGRTNKEKKNHQKSKSNNKIQKHQRNYSFNINSSANCVKRSVSMNKLHQKDNNKLHKRITSYDLSSHFKGAITTRQKNTHKINYKANNIKSERIDNNFSCNYTHRKNKSLYHENRSSIDNLIISKQNIPQKKNIYNYTYKNI